MTGLIRFYDMKGRLIREDPVSSAKPEEHRNLGIYPAGSERAVGVVRAAAEDEARRRREGR